MAASPVTLSLLAAAPAQLERLLRSLPEGCVDWAPESWEGIPGEAFTARGQLCHVRDIEVLGYQVRIRRLLSEEVPALVSLDGYALAEERRYAASDPFEALASFRDARAATLALLAPLGERDWQRRGSFEGYGPVTLTGLIHYLSSHDQQHLACLQWLLGKYLSRP